MTPTPKTITYIEIIFIFCFFFSFKLKNYINILKNIFFLKKSNELFFFFILVYIASSNLLVIKDNNILSYQGLRDLIAFLFIFLIILFSHEKRSKKIKNYYLYYAIIFGWVLLGKEILVQVYHGRPLGGYIWLNFNFSFVDPLIYFSLNYLFLYIVSFYKKINFFVTISGSLFLIISLYFCYNASIKLFLFSIAYFIFFFLYSFLSKKFSIKNYFDKIIIIIFFLLFSLFIFYNDFNNRHSELLSIFTGDFINSNLLFGRGLGSKYFNIVIQGDVAFTHSILTYFILKLGLIGILLLLLFFISTYNLLNLNFINFKNLKLKNNLVLHSFIPILFSSFFYTNYKTFSFWLISGIVLYYLRNKNVKSY